MPGSVAQFGPRDLKPATPAIVYGYQANLAAAAYIELLNVTGKGYLFDIAGYSSGAIGGVGLYIQVDGGTALNYNFKPDNASIRERLWANHSTPDATYQYGGKIPLFLRFGSSCVVRLYNREVAAYNVGGYVFYALT